MPQSRGRRSGASQTPPQPPDRKMQKTVYRVRTLRAIEGRLGLDLLRESQAADWAGTTKMLCEAREA